VFDCAEEIYSAYVADSMQSSWITCEFAEGYCWNGYYSNGVYGCTTWK